jgi:hypothetical protein
MADDILNRLWREDGATTERRYALLNHAACPWLLRQLKRFPGVRWNSLFASSREERALEVAPILIDLGPAGALHSAAAMRLAAWLVETCRISNALLFLRSDRDASQMTVALAARLDATLPQGLAVLLRYFDTRVFASLLQVFTPEQRAAFLSVARTWLWLDRAGAAMECSGEDSAEDPWKPVTFTQDQEDALVQASEPDAVVHRLWGSAPDLCRGRTPAHLHAEVQSLLEAARCCAVDDATSQALFCMAGLQHGTDFHRQPDWQLFITQARAQGRKFDWVVQQWETGSRA